MILALTATVQKYMFDCTVTVASMLDVQGVPIENNLQDKILYFSKGSTDFSQTFQICIWIYTSPANFIETSDMVQQIQ